jgi:hypothetical protein
MALSADPRSLRAPLAALVVALLAAPACSHDAAAPSRTAPQDVRTRPEAAPAAATDGGEARLTPTSGQIRRNQVAAEPVLVSTPAPASIGERRCGWLSNPTPGNWWLFDGHGEWILATQGGDQAPGFDDMPDMSTAGWVETNGHHGYGCACMTISHDPATRRVTGIAAARPKPLKQCRADRGLPRP